MESVNFREESAYYICILPLQQLVLYVHLTYQQWRNAWHFCWLNDDLTTVIISEQWRNVQFGSRSKWYCFTFI